MSKKIYLCTNNFYTLLATVSYCQILAPLLPNLPNYNFSECTLSARSQHAMHAFRTLFYFVTNINAGTLWLKYIVFMDKF